MKNLAQPVVTEQKELAAALKNSARAAEERASPLRWVTSFTSAAAYRCTPRAAGLRWQSLACPFDGGGTTDIDVGDYDLEERTEAISVVS